MVHRLTWAEVPTRVRDQLTKVLDAPVVSRHSATGGYSPALASRCELADGRSVFVKAASLDLNPATVDAMRREVRTAAALPPDAPAPRLLHVLDDEGWTVVVFEAIDGTVPAVPWTQQELTRVAHALPSIAALPTDVSVRPAADAYGEMFRGWERLRADPPARTGAWWERELDDLCALEAQWSAAATGDAFVHGDVRSDNVLLTDERVVFVDWASCAIGAPWLDAVLAATSIAHEGGGPPESFIALVGHDVPIALLLPVVAAVAGYFTDAGRRAEPPRMPTVRAAQRERSAIALAWLHRVLSRR